MISKRRNARKLREMGRVLYSHQWNEIDEWVRSVEALAELSDDEILELERLTHVRGTETCPN